MEGILHALLTFRAVKLGQQHRRAGAQSDEKAVHQVQQCGGRPHRRQRPGADEPADDDGVHGIVHLLEKAPKQNGKEKEKQLLPDHASVMRCDGNSPCIKSASRRIYWDDSIIETADCPLIFSGSAHRVQQVENRKIEITPGLLSRQPPRVIPLRSWYLTSVG